MKKGNQYKKILRISANLISQKGYHGVSLQQIADKTRIHKSSLFHYFKNKEELLHYILETPFDEFYRNFKEIIANQELKPEEKLKKAIDNHLTLLIEYRANVNIFLNDLVNLSVKNRNKHMMSIWEYERGFEKIILEMGREGHFNGLDPKIVSFGILGMLNWTTRWYKKSGSLAIQEISDNFYRMVTKP
jgi:AcrR family transcriptional regulator